MQTGDRPDPFRIAGGLLLFVFAALTPACGRKISANLSSSCSKTARRVSPAGRFDIILCAYQRTVRGAAVKALHVAVASVSASTCVLPSSAAYTLCSSG